MAEIISIGIEALAEYVVGLEEFATIQAAIDAGFVETANGFFGQIYIIEGGSAAPIISIESALDAATTAQTLGETLSASQTTVQTAKVGLLKTGTGYKVAPVLGMELGAAGAAVAPLLGVALGAGLYHDNPKFWTDLSQKLLPFAYPGTTTIPSWVDIALDTQTGKFIYNCLVDIGVVEAVKDVFDEYDIPRTPVYTSDYNGETVFSSQSAYLSDSSAYSAISWYGCDIVPVAYAENTAFTVYLFSRVPTVCKRVYNGVTTDIQVLSQNTTENGTVYYRGIAGGYSADPSLISPINPYIPGDERHIATILYDGAKRLATVYPTGTAPYAGEAAPDYSPEEYPSQPIRFVPDPEDPDIIHVVPNTPTAPEDPQIIPFPGPYEPGEPENWPEEEPWPEVIPFPWPDPDPDPDKPWPTVIPWPLPEEPPEEWPTTPDVPEQWPEEFPEGEPWPRSPEDWPEEVPWPNNPPNEWPNDVPWPENPTEWPEEVPWPTPWPEEWPADEPWPVEWPEGLPYPSTFPQPLPTNDPDEEPNPETPTNPEKTVEPWVEPTVDPDVSNNPSEQPTPVPSSDPSDNDAEPISPYYPPTPSSTRPFQPSGKPDKDSYPPDGEEPPPSGISPWPNMPVSGSGFDSTHGLISVYNPTSAELFAFCDWLWVTYADATIDKIWNNPFDGIITLFELYCTPTVNGRKNIRAGFLDSQIAADTISRYTEIDCGTLGIPEYYGNYFDYSPYSKAHIYLPFIGIQELNVDDIVGHFVNVTYRIDEYNGSCIAMITCAKVTEVNGENVEYSNTVYQFSGNCSVEYPLTGGSQASIKSGMMIGDSYQNAGHISAVSSLVGGIGSILSTNPIGGLVSGIGGYFTQNAYANASQLQNMLSGKSTVQKSGSFGASHGALGIKTPFITVIRPKQVAVNNYNQLYGYPSHRMVTIGTCEGFLRCREVHVISSTATDEEKTAIEQLLKSGVYVTE